MFRKILIANRGEIAVRIIRACRDLGVPSAAVYSEVDRTALHVRLADEAYLCGPPRASESYLAGERILDLAVACGADAIHPGYGFLSENGDFAERCAARGVVFIGPSPSVIRTMGDKVAARRCVEGVGIATVPGTDERLSDDEIAARASEIGYPVMLKASAGGGGKGMRLVAAADGLASSVARARGEALASFGDDGVYLEKYLERTRHIEVQILADAHGHVLHLFERECSLQRRHQKLVEEAPANGLVAERRAELGRSAVMIAEAVGYVGVGTCEFLLDGDDLYFLEMNTRLQVEHAVTEAITGVDLVQEMIRVAAGEPLGFSQDEVSTRGHAIEARIYAEDPDKKFAPTPGKLLVYRPADGVGVRVDGGVQEGDTISAFYDPMLAKLVVWGADRDQCLSRLRRALDEFAIRGVKTSLPLHRGLVRNPCVVRGEYDTAFVDRELDAILAGAGPDPDAEALCAVLAAVSAASGDAPAEPAGRPEAANPSTPSIPAVWRVSERKGESWVVSLVSLAGTRFRVGIESQGGATREWELDVAFSATGMTSVIRAGVQSEVAIDRSERKGVCHIDVALPERRMRLIVEPVEPVESVESVEPVESVRPVEQRSSG